MRTLELKPNQVITLNDYPVHSDEVLSEYFNKCRLGRKMPFVPLIEKRVVKKYLDKKLLGEFKKFEIKNPSAEYFMLDGSHRTTALTLAGCKIRAMVLESDEDFIEAGKLVSGGEVRASGIFDHNFEENCRILNRHFLNKSYFMTVEQKTEKMIKEKILPKEMSEFSR